MIDLFQQADDREAAVPKPPKKAVLIAAPKGDGVSYSAKDIEEVTQKKNI